MLKHLIIYTAVLLLMYINYGLAENKQLLDSAILRADNLVDVQKLDSTIQVKLVYATTDNFLHANVYGTLTTCYMRKESAEKLAKAQELLHKKFPHYNLLVYDGLRPRRVQRQMWAIVKGTPQQGYVADPDKGSIHNYGAAVDLTIADNKGIPLDMGTPYDYFGIKAQPRYESFFLHPESIDSAKIETVLKKVLHAAIDSAKALTDAQINNRLLLREVMQQTGFIPFRNEWWHFDSFPKDEVRKKFSIVE